MKNLLKVLVIVFIFDVNFATAEQHDHKDSTASVTKVSKQEVVVKVNGMVCSFCAQGIKKNFNKRPEVKSTSVDLDTMEVKIVLKPGKQLLEKDIKKVVTDAGFSFVGVK